MKSLVKHNMLKYFKLTKNNRPFNPGGYLMYVTYTIAKKFCTLRRIIIMDLARYKQRFMYEELILNKYRM